MRVILGRGHQIRRSAPGAPLPGTTKQSGSHTLQPETGRPPGPPRIQRGPSCCAIRLELPHETFLTGAGAAPGSWQERRQRLHGNVAEWSLLKLLTLRMSRQEHFSRLSCLPEGFRGGLLYFMKMETTEQVESQAGWF